MSEFFTLKTLAIFSLGASSLYYGKTYFNGAQNHIVKDMTGKVVLITGGNAGIGKETARELAKLNATVVIASRDASKTLPVIQELKEVSKNSNINYIPLDLGDLKSIEDFSKTFNNQYQRLDVLVNNAGVFCPPTRMRTKDGFELQFGTNYLGHFYLTELLLDKMKGSTPSRIVNLTSWLNMFVSMNWDDLMYTKNYSPIKGYAQAALATVIWTRELQRKLDREQANVKVVTAHPGIVNTEAARKFSEEWYKKLAFMAFSPIANYALKTPLQGAQTSLYLALEDHDKLDGGVYYKECSKSSANKIVENVEVRERLWKVSEEYIREAKEKRNN